MSPKIKYDNACVICDLSGFSNMVNELSISINDVAGVPRVTLRGKLDIWHDRALAGILDRFSGYGRPSLVLDIIDLNFSGIVGARAFIKALKSIRRGTNVHVIADKESATVLKRARLGRRVKLYSAADSLVW